jgi:hypothetical protein
MKPPLGALPPSPHGAKFSVCNTRTSPSQLWLGVEVWEQALQCRGAALRPKTFSLVDFNRVVISLLGGIQSCQGYVG